MHQASAQRSFSAPFSPVDLSAGITTPAPDASWRDRLAPFWCGWHAFRFSIANERGERTDPFLDFVWISWYAALDGGDRSLAARGVSEAIAREVDLALLIADLCGYTALTEAHGAMHASEVVLRFGRLAGESLEPGVAIIDCVGDAVLCAGPDALAVVRTARRLREAVQRQPSFLDVRTGIHLGRVVERERRLFGAPINLVARVAAHAQGGQILCTEAVAHAVRAVGGLETRAMGKKRFKNVAHRVAVFELTGVGAPASTTAVDPVCRMQVEVSKAAATIAYAGTTYCFCSLECSRSFAQAPELYIVTG